MRMHLRHMSTMITLARRAPIAAMIVVALFGGARAASGQPASSASRPAWAFTFTAGGFVRGNGHAVTSWLRRNAYGAAAPEHCVFDVLLNRVCSSPDDYPQMTGRTLVAGMLSVRRSLSDRLSLELLAATEQSGTAKGHCDERAVPRDARCGQGFMVVDFSGGSFASLAVLTTRHLRLGAGPALLLANWRMKPAHLPGVWLDVTSGFKSSPWFARAQYRYYRSATGLPSEGFSAFHPSTLFLGIGFLATTDNSP
jgi:hypothetical protein